MFLLQDPVFLLLIIIVLGDALGRIEWRKFSIGPAAIIFVALTFGHFGHIVPDGVRSIGLAMFIYAVALQAGPGFINSFRSHGLTMTITVLALAATGTLAAWICSLVCGFDAGTGAGLLAGAMTSTPALAAAVELVGHAEAPAAYGVTYGFGVLGVALYVKILPRLLRRNLRREEEELAHELETANPPITRHHIEITNPGVFGKRIDSLNLQAVAPVTITRLLRQGESEPILVRGETLLAPGDRIRIVGREDDLARVECFLGTPIAGEIAFDRVLTKQSIVVSKAKFAGKTLGFFNVRDVFNVQITRVTRNGIDIPPASSTRLHLGDILHAVGDERALRNLTRILGNDVKATYDISLLPVLVGLLCAFLLSRVTLPLPLIGPLTLGLTGGALIVGLLLGGLYNTGPLIWDVPAAGNRLIRDLGLALFMAAVGTSAGATFVATLQDYGFPLLLSGVVVTLAPLLIATAVGLSLFRIRFLRLLGVLVGGMTSASGLAAANGLSPTPYAQGAYATVYPVAMLAKIVAVKVLVMLMG